MQLPVYTVGIEVGVHFFDYISLTLEFNVEFVKDLLFLETEA